MYTYNYNIHKCGKQSTFIHYNLVPLKSLMSNYNDWSPSNLLDIVPPETTLCITSDTNTHIIKPPICNIKTSQVGVCGVCLPCHWQYLTCHEPTPNISAIGEIFHTDFSEQVRAWPPPPATYVWAVAINPQQGISQCWIKLPQRHQMTEAGFVCSRGWTICIPILIAKSLLHKYSILLYVMSNKEI